MNITGISRTYHLRVIHILCALVQVYIYYLLLVQVQQSSCVKVDA